MGKFLDLMERIEGTFWLFNRKVSYLEAQKEHLPALLIACAHRRDIIRKSIVRFQYLMQAHQSGNLQLPPQPVIAHG